jgi:putative spermidine/putrescine transport system permease protein
MSKQRSRSRAASLRSGGFLLSIPLLLLLTAFFVLPLFDLVRVSLVDPEDGVTVQNYQDFLGTPAYRRILFRTFFVATACTLICLLFAYPYAYLMTITSARMRRILMILVLLPFWTSLMVRTYAWLVLLQDTGPVKAAMDIFGLGGIPLIRSTSGVLIGMSQILLPFMVLPLYNNLQKIDRADLLAAQSLGATPRRAFWRAYFPQSLPGVFAGSLLVFIMALGFYITPAILGSPSNALMSQLIVTQVTARLDFASAGAMATVLAVVTLVFVALATRAVSVQSAFGGEGRSE